MSAPVFPSSSGTEPVLDEGIDFALEQLCAVLGVDQSAVSWDAATETTDGDVRAVIGNIMRTKYGEDWEPLATSPTPQIAGGVRELLEDAREWIASNILNINLLSGEEARKGESLAHSIDAALSPQARASDMARLSASESACYRWPDDTAEHKALRAAFEEGAAHVSGVAQGSPERGEPVAYLHTMWMERGQIQSRLTHTAPHPFGLPGKHYSEEYKITSTPLYASAVSSTDREAGK